MQRILIVLCVSVCLSAGCASVPADMPAAAPDMIQDGFILTEGTGPDFPVGVQFAAKDGDEVWNYLLGTVSRCSDDPGNITNLGKFVEIEAPFRYYWKGDYRTVNIYLVYANLGEIPDRFFPGYIIRQEDLSAPVGKAGTGTSPVFRGPDVLFAVYTKKPDVFAEYITSSSGVSRLGVYWYSPMNFVNGWLPVPNLLFYKDISFSDYDFFSSRGAEDTWLRFAYTLDSYPDTQNTDFIMLYMNAVLAGKIPDYDTMNYFYSLSEERDDGKVILLFPEKLVEVYRQNRFLKSEIYLFARIVAENDTELLLVVDNSMNAAPEYMWRDPDTKNIFIK